MVFVPLVHITLLDLLFPFYVQLVLSTERKFLRSFGEASSHPHLIYHASSPAIALPPLTTQLSFQKRDYSHHLIPSESDVKMMCSILNDDTLYVTVDGSYVIQLRCEAQLPLDEIFTKDWSEDEKEEREKQIQEISRLVIYEISLNYDEKFEEYSIILAPHAMDRLGQTIGDGEETEDSQELTCEEANDFLQGL